MGSCRALADASPHSSPVRPTLCQNVHNIRDHFSRQPRRRRPAPRAPAIGMPLAAGERWRERQRTAQNRPRPGQRPRKPACGSSSQASTRASRHRRYVVS
eukprot:13697013-Alexandrium_andersonii.AAC.1